MEILGNADLEALNQVLNDDTQIESYLEPYNDYRPLLVPRILGALLVGCGTLVYGSKPTYSKFRAIEVIARVPYHSWEHAAFTLLTFFYTDEKRALALSRTSNYVRIAQDNETMHVIVISQLAKSHGHIGVFRHTLIPMLFAFGYFTASYILYLVRPRWSYELNFLFESHAYAQYHKFITEHEEMLKKAPILSDFLTQYGRNPVSQYDFFKSVRNDEAIHRNESIHHIDYERDASGSWKIRAFCVAVVLLILFAIVF